MKTLEAAAKILSEAGEPLHYRKITELVLQQELWQTEGKTPWETVNAQMALNILKHEQDSLFQRTKPGIFALRSWGLPEYTPKKSQKGKIKQPKADKTIPKKADSLPKAKTFSFSDAAEKVLKEYGHREPMHYRIVTEKILEQGLVQTQGLTPASTLYSVILQEIKRKKKQGEVPRFVNYGKGYFGLSQWLPTGLASRITQHNNEIRRKLLLRLRKMDWAEFEELVGQLIITMGFEDVIVTPKGGDGGIDVRGTLVVGEVIRTRMAIQVKRWKYNVLAPIVQQVRGSLGAHEQGLIITTSDFSKGARHEAERADATPVALMNGSQLVKVLIENDVGIRRTPYDLLDLLEDDEPSM
jgi:restriction system protein